MDNFDTIEKKIRGYGFDSLVFRYKLARENEARLQYRDDWRNGIRKHDERYYMDNAERDIMRFIQILNDLIGERD